MTTEIKPTYTEACEQMTGFDELAIEKKFGTDFDSLRFTMQLRALVFIDRKRAGKSEKDAYDEAMSLTVKAFEAEFTPEDDADEIVPDEPVTPAGEGDAPSE